MLPTCNVVEDTNRGVLKLTVPPGSNTTPAVQIIYVLDVSHSMREDAIVKDEETGEKKKLELTYTNRDINLHGLLVSLNSMSERDWACVITFGSGDPKLIVPWMRMDSAGKATAEEMCRKPIEYLFATMFGSCIEKFGNQMMLSPLHDNVNSAVIWYTDGIPSDSLPASTFKDRISFWKDECSSKNELSYDIYTLGIGKGVNSDLLSALGTRFIHIYYTAHLADFTRHLMAHIYAKRFDELKIEVNTGATLIRDCMQGPWVEGVTRYIAYTGKLSNLQINGMDVSFIISSADDKNEIGKAHMMTKAYRAVHGGIPAQVRKAMDDPDIYPELYHDLDQVYLGLHDYKFKEKWGQHFYKAFSQELSFQALSSLLNKCMQEFTSDALKVMVDHSTTIFGAVNAPVPTSEVASRLMTASAPPRPMALPDEFNRGGGCMDPDTTLMFDVDGKIHVSTIQDITTLLMHHNVKIKTLHGWDTIECVVASPTNDSTVLVDVDGNIFTQWHPLRKLASDEWEFANSMSDVICTKKPEFVFNIVTENRNPVLVYGQTGILQYATLGHSKVTGTNDPVAYHAFWSTEHSINKLKESPFYASKYVVLTNNIQGVKQCSMVASLFKNEVSIASIL